MSRGLFPSYKYAHCEWLVKRRLHITQSVTMGRVSSLLNIVPIISLVCLALSATDVARAAIQVLSNTTLGPDPQTVNRLNGESFQQEALVTFNGTNGLLSYMTLSMIHTRAGYQYAAFWLADTSNSSVRHPSVSRRDLSADPSSPGEWDTFTFMDYNQTEDDGHDMYVSSYHLRIIRN